MTYMTLVWAFAFALSSIIMQDSDNHIVGDDAVDGAKTTNDSTGDATSMT